MLTARAQMRRPPTADDLRLLAACQASFWAFLPHWPYICRESGEVRRFTSLWPGQARLARAMEQHPWLFALKAGKLGFSELACAWDGWRLRFGPPNSRVHLFSRSSEAARDMMAWVRFGLDRLPPALRLPVRKDGAGSDTSQSVRYLCGPDDVRTLVAYAAGPNVSIDQTCQHAHVDEFARMPFGEQLWQAVETTVSPDGGTCHIVTRGAGPNFAAEMYRDAVAGRSKLWPLFERWDARPGRDAGWRAAEAQALTQSGLWQFAPETWQEALQGDASYVYPQFDVPKGRHIVVADPCGLAECRRVAVGVDPGAVNPTAMVLLGERTSGRAHQYAEFYRPGCGVDELEAQLAAWQRQAGRTRLRIFVPGDEKTLAATLRAHGLDCWPAQREVALGIQLVTQRLNTEGYTVHERCRHTIDEFRDYRNSVSTDRQTRVSYAGERPLKHHADAMDALRYAVCGLAGWQEARPVALPNGRVYYGR